MKNLLSSQLLLRCSKQLDLIAENTPYGENLHEDSKRKSFFLVEAVCHALAVEWGDANGNSSQMKVLSNGKKEMESLLEAASLRILLVSGCHPKARTDDDDDDCFLQQRVEWHVTFNIHDDLPRENNLWLSPMKDVVLPGECARLAWTILPILEHNNLSQHLGFKLDPESGSQMNRLIKHHADELNGIGVYTRKDKLPMSILASQLRRVSITAAKHPKIRSRFKASSVLAKDVRFIYTTMQRQLQDDTLSTLQELSQLKKVPCIYNHQKEDAGGLLEDDGYAFLH
jgi:hypothetical protein